MMKIFAYALVAFLNLSQVNFAQAQPVKAISSKSDHPKNASGVELIAETKVLFKILKYADGSVQWVPQGNVQTVVSKEHVKIYNKQALDALPHHLHKAHKKHVEGKSSEEETVSLATLSTVLGTNDPVFREVASGIVKGAVGAVAGVITGNPFNAVKGVIQAGTSTFGAIKVLHQYDMYLGNKRVGWEKDIGIMPMKNRPPGCTGFVCN